MERDSLIHGLELVNDWLIVLDGSRVEYANRTILEELDRSSDEVLGSDVEDLLPHVFAMHLESVLAELEGTTDVRVERAIDVEELSMGITSYHITGERHGGLTYLALSRLPATEGGDERLADVEDRLAALLALTASAGIGVGVFSIGKDGSLNLRSLNQHGLALFGRTEKEMLESSPIEFVHPDDRHIVENTITQLIETGSADPILIRVYDSEGELTRLRIANTLLSDASKGMGIGFVQDMTSTYEALEQENRMVQAIERVEETVVLANEMGEIIYANPAALRNSGYALEEVLGQPISLFGSPEAVGPMSDTVIEELLTRGWWRGDVMACSKDGKRYPVEVISSVIRDERDAMNGLVVVSRKIEERQSFEAQLMIARGSHDWVRWLIEKRAFPDIQKTIDRLEELMREETDPKLTERVSAALEGLTTLLDRARVRLAELPGVEEFKELRPIRIAPLFLERVPMVTDRMSDKGIDIEVEVAVIDDDIEVMANTLLSELFVRLIDIIVNLSSSTSPTIVLGIDSTVPPGIPGVEPIPGDQPDEPCFARVTFTSHGTALSEDLRGALARREMPTMGVPSDSLRFAIETSRLLVSIYKGQIFIEDVDVTDPGKGFVIVVLLPLAGTRPPALPKRPPMFKDP
jgi:PAS domain S-box-containing protein